MLVTPFNSLTATIGKVALLKFVRTDSLALVLALVVVVALPVDVEGSVAGLVVVVALVVVEDSVVDLVEVGVDLEVAMVEVAVEVLMQEQQVLRHHPTHLPTMLRLAVNEARLSMFAT